MEKVVRVPLFTDKIEPYQYKWLIKLLSTQEKEVKETFNNKIRTLEIEKEEALKDLERTKGTLSEIFLKHYKVCLECRGEGKLIDYRDAHDDTGICVKCQYCNGAGYIKKEEI